MDPFSQGVVGAIYPQSIVKNKKKLVPATIIGILSGMAPDIDSFVNSAKDPLLNLEYHRQLTHSLFFIPIGSFILTCLLYKFFKKKLSFREVYLYSFIGYATHGLLDACTSYGTQLLYPLSNLRISWDVISIIDPLFTIPLMVLTILTIRKRNIQFARYAVLYSLLYLSLGFIQEKRARNFTKELALKRGHTPTEITAKPSFANLFLWKIIYRHEDRYFVDAVHLLAGKKIYEGESVKKLDIDKDFSWLPKVSTHYKDIQRFAWFSSNYLAIHPDFPNVIGDLRYSVVPHQVRPLWGIRLNSKLVNKHVAFESFRSNTKNQFQLFWKMLAGKDL